MRPIILLFFTMFLLNSCNSSSDNANDLNAQSSIKKDVNTNANTGGKYWQELVMHDIKDNKGVVSASIPLPASWQLNVNGVSVSGPRNVRVADFAPQSFMMNYDPSLQYAYSQTPMRAMPGIAQLIQEDIVPFMAKKGYSFVKYDELPEISKLDKWYSDQLFKAMPTQSYVKAFGIDLLDKNNHPAFLILHINQSESQFMQSWYYWSSLLVADANVFEMAKKQLIFGLSNMRYNLEPIMTYNREEAQRVGQSWAAFNQRMANNQAAFEAQQRNHINKTNAINDAIMSSWNEKNKSMDKNQEQFIDNIYERQNVQNTETGENYKVESGYNKYWMNSDGEYIATQKQDYNPNADENMNRQNWQELKVKK